LALAVFVVFARVVGFKFLTLDDGLYVYENAYVTQGLTAPGLLWALTSVHANYWLPLTFISFMMDATLFGPGPAGFHLTNLLLHVANVVLLYLVLKRATGSARLALFVAAVFAFHPSRLEAVAWVTSRKDVLSTFFGFIAILAYLTWSRARRWPAYAALLAAFSASLLSKAMLVTLPALLLLADYWPLRRWTRKAGSMSAANASQAPFPAQPAWRLVAEKLPLLLIAGTAAVWTLMLHPFAGAPEGSNSLIRAALQAGINYGGYLCKVAWPPEVSLGLPTPTFTPLRAFGMWGVIGTLSILALGRCSPPWFRVGWFWFLIALVPVVGVVRGGSQEVADRFLYVPIIGLALIAAGWIERGIERGGWHARVTRLATACAILVMVGLVTVRLSRWRDTVHLFKPLVARYQADSRVWNALGRAKELQGHLEDAMAAYNNALAAQPHDLQATINRANILEQLGQLEEAVRSLRAAMERQPSDARLRSNLGVFEFRAGNVAEGVKLLRESLAMDRHLLDTRYNLALALHEMRQDTEARRVLLDLLQLHPTDQAAQRLLRELGGP